jgi:hypothetical protein
MSLVHDITELRSRCSAVQQTSRVAAETEAVPVACSEVQVALCISLVAAREADKQWRCCHLLARLHLIAASVSTRQDGVSDQMWRRTVPTNSIVKLICSSDRFGPMASAFAYVTPFWIGRSGSVELYVSYVSFLDVLSSVCNMYIYYWHGLNLLMLT